MSCVGVLGGSAENSAEQHTPQVFLARSLDNDLRSALTLLYGLTHTVDRVVLGWQGEGHLRDSVSRQRYRLCTVRFGFARATATPSAIGETLPNH